MLIPRLSVFPLRLTHARFFLKNWEGKKIKREEKRKKERAQFCFQEIAPYKYRYFNEVKFCLKKKWI